MVWSVSLTRKLLLNLRAWVVSVTNNVLRPKASTGKTIEAFAQKAKTAPPSTIPMMNGATNGTTNDTTSASQTTAGAPAPSTTSFKGAANNFVAMGVTTFIGMAIACLM